MTGVESSYHALCVPSCPKNERNARLEQQVLVTIVDVNDNAPLLQPFDGAVLENTDSTLITTIQAVDKDASPQYRQVCVCVTPLHLQSHPGRGRLSLTHTFEAITTFLFS